MPNQEKVQGDVKVKLVQIVELGFFLKRLVQPFQATNVDFQMSNIIHLNENQKIVSILTHCSAISKDDQIEYGSFDLACSFEVENFQDIFTLKEDNTIDLPRDMMKSLLSISHSTFRGAWFSKFQSTYLKPFYIPLANPEDLIKDLAETYPLKEQ